MSNKIGTIEKLMDGYNPMRQRMEETRGLVKKWEPTGLLEGLKDEQKVHIQKSGVVLLYHWLEKSLVS